jgi:SAM-dependent methyltransferase
VDDPIEINRRNCARRSTPGRLSAMRLAVCGRAKMRFSQSKAELGDISGKRVLRLQCHIGRDTLCLARRGAVVTGLDFSPAAIECARRLSMESGLTATFIQGSVDQTPRLVPGPFDLVFTTWGILCWLPDMRALARVIASVLAPGGELYCADADPSFVALEEQAGIRFPAPPDRPREFVDTEPTTYMGDPAPMAHQATRVWIHSLSAIFASLIDAGLALPWRRCAADVTVRPTIALFGRCAEPRTRDRPSVAAARWPLPHALVLFDPGKKADLSLPRQRWKQE